MYLPRFIPVERRRHPRFKPQGVHTRIGEVADISRSGLCVFRKGGRMVELGETFDIRLEHDTGVLEALVRVAWIQTVGFRRQTLGLEFVDPTSDLEAAIDRFAPAESREFVGPQAYLLR